MATWTLFLILSRTFISWNCRCTDVVKKKVFILIPVCNIYRSFLISLLDYLILIVSLCDNWLSALFLAVRKPLWTVFAILLLKFEQDEDFTLYTLRS